MGTRAATAVVAASSPLSASLTSFWWRTLVRKPVSCVAVRSPAT